MLLGRSFFPKFGQGPFPKIAGKSPECSDNVYPYTPHISLDIDRKRDEPINLRNTGIYILHIISIFLEKSGLVVFFHSSVKIFHSFYINNKKHFLSKSMGRFCWAQKEKFFLEKNKQNKSNQNSSSSPSLIPRLTLYRVA